MGNYIFFLIILFIIVSGVISVLMIVLYNQIIQKEESVNNAFAEIKNYYKRKLDLINDIIEELQKYTGYERETLEQIVGARTAAIEKLNKLSSSIEQNTSSELSESDKKLSANLGNLLSIVINYPELKANSNFIMLQEQLEISENQIAQARSIYNDEVRIFNSYIQSFPQVCIAYILETKQKSYFEYDSEKIE